MSDEWRNGYNLPDIVNLSKEVSSRTLENVKTQVVHLLQDYPFIVTDCPRAAQEIPVTDTSCPFYIKAPIFRNCSLVANFFGPFTAKEVAYMMDLTIDSVYHIEKSAMKKLQGKFTVLDRKDMLP